MDTPRESDTIAGVPLARYAAVNAALAEPFPLDDVLASEDLDAAGWAEADLAWTERLVDDPALLGRYESALAAAQDRLSRSVEPLDGDLGAWVAFLAAMSSAAPRDLLGRHGLGPNDLARLHRGWARRMKADPAIERRAAEIARRPPPVPRLRVAPSVLRKQRSATLEGPPPSVENSVENKDAVRLREHRRFATMTGLGPAPTPAPVSRPPPPSLPRPPSSAVPPRAPPRPPRAASGRDPLAMPPPPPPVARHDDEPTRTRMMIAAPAPELPFRVTPSRAYIEALQASGAEPGEGSDGETEIIAMDTPTPAPKEPRLSGLPCREPEPEPEHLMRTAMAVPISAPLKPLPFVERKAWDTSRVPVVGRDDEDDEDDEDDPTRVVEKSRRVPTILGIEDPETVTGVSEPASGNAPLPFVSGAPASPDGADRKTGMSIERHASLTVELAFDPAGSAQILARYKLTAAAKRKTDAAFKALFAADPALRTAWNHAFDVYREWFVANRAKT